MRVTLLRYIILGAAISFGQSVLAETSSYQLVDRIAAVVGESIVFQSEVKERLKDTSNHLRVSDYPAGEKADRRLRMIHDLINQKLILKHLEDKDAKPVSDAEVDGRIQEILRSNGGLPLAEFEQMLMMRGKSIEEYRKDLRDQMMIYRFIGMQIRPKIKVTENDLRSYFLKRAGATSDAIELVVRSIEVRTSPEMPPEIKKDKQQFAQMVLTKLKTGIEFKKAQEIYSDGERGEFDRQQTFALKHLAKSMQQGLESLKEGEYSEPIYIGNSYYIFRIDKRRVGTSEEFLTKKPQLEQELINHKMRELLNQWLRNSRRANKIKIYLN